MGTAYRTILFTLALAWPAMATANSLESQNSQPDDPTLATLEGAVINTQNNRTVSRASVTIIGLRGAGSKSTRADGNGHFLFEHIEPGRYKLVADGPGFFADERKPGYQPTFEISAGQYLKNMQVRLTPTAAISGDIFDEYNDPVQSVEVTLLAVRMRLGQMSLFIANKATTDDRGRYRIAGLHPGKYYLVAEYKRTVSNGMADIIRSNMEELLTQPKRSRVPLDAAQLIPDAAFSYPPLFYPATSDFQQAESLHLDPGDEVSANFILSSAPVVSIQGRVVNGFTGRAPAAGSVAAFWSPYMEGDGIPVRTASETGEFVIRGVAPGLYTLRASFTDDKQNFAGEQTVEVGIRGAQNVIVAALPDFTAAGHVTVAAELRQNPVTHVAIEFAGEGLLPRIRASATLPLMKFEAQLRPDRRYYATIRNLPEDYYLKSISVFGHELPPDNIVVSGIGGAMELVLSPAGGHVEGTLLDAKNQPTRGSILLVPDLADPGPTDLFRRTTADSKGKFTLRGIAPGSYRVVAMSSLNFETALNSPEFLRTLANQGQAIMVEENGKYAIALSLSNTESQE